MASITLRDINFGIEVAVFAIAIYILLRFLRSTRGGGIVRGLIFIGILFGLGLIALLNSTQLPHLEYVLRAIVEIVIIGLVILFQPELRRGISRLGENPLLSRFARTTESKILGEVSKAVTRMSHERIGALIAFERDFSLESYIEEGVKLDAKVTQSLLESIFQPGGALHDGAVIIRGERIAAAACVLPLSENSDLPKSLGTRHRAAIGLTEVGDAITLVVSEENGAISICVKGEIHRNIAPAELENWIKRTLFREPVPEPAAKAGA